VATLVRLPAADAPRGPVLYVHGFIDYFFQRHMAERFAAEGYAFYALDLRKHGARCSRTQHPCFCKDSGEYHDDTRARCRNRHAECCWRAFDGRLVCSPV
jgi:alpha-beta hydrolase superfamily lysophospholipase